MYKAYSGVGIPKIRDRLDCPACGDYVQTFGHTGVVSIDCVNPECSEAPSTTGYSLSYTQDLWKKLGS